MKKYRIIKNFDNWFNVDVPNNENTIITEKELEELARGWETTVEDLMKDLEEIED